MRVSDEAIRNRTQETAKKLFGGGIKMDPPYLTWKEFDKDLANDFSMHITGNLYSRTVLTLPERQMVACAMLAALRARDAERSATRRAECFGAIRGGESPDHQVLRSRAGLRWRFLAQEFDFIAISIKRVKVLLNFLLMTLNNIENLSPSGEN